MNLQPLQFEPSHPGLEYDDPEDLIEEIKCGRLLATDYYGPRYGGGEVCVDKPLFFSIQPAIVLPPAPKEKHPLQQEQPTPPPKFYQPIYEKPRLYKPQAPASSRQRIIELTNAVRAAGKKEERNFRKEIKKAAGRRGEIDPKVKRILRELGWL